MGFSWQEYWGGLPFPSPGDLPDPGIEPRSLTLHEDSLAFEPQGGPVVLHMSTLALITLHSAYWYTGLYPVTGSIRTEFLSHISLYALSSHIVGPRYTFTELMISE